MSEFRFYMTVFTMIAVLVAGVSPACAFMFGKSDFLLEICAPDGSVQEIVVGDAFNPFAQEVPMEEMLEVMEQCAFCFSGAHQVADVVYAFQMPVVLPSSYLRVSGGLSVPLSADYQTYRPRGPPVFS